MRIFSRNSPIVGSDKEGRVFMKKIYSKPEIMFDSFTLTTNIAAGCGKKIDTHVNGVCGLELSGVGKAFLDNIAGCEVKFTESDEYCYHVPTEDNKLFNS